MKEYTEHLLHHLDKLEEDIEVIKVNAQLDHIHLVVVIPPRVSVASVVEYMKSQTSKKLKEKFEFMGKAIYGRSRV